MDTDMIMAQLLEIGFCNIRLKDIKRAMRKVDDATNLNQIIDYMMDNAHDIHNNSDNEENEAKNDDMIQDEEKNDLQQQQQQKPVDFAWRCHKCETWYIHSENELCTKCVPFEKLPASVIRPGRFVYRPGYKADIIAFGYIRGINGYPAMISIDGIAGICHQYLSSPTYDTWDYIRCRFDDHGKDIAVNHLNNRVQYRAQPDLLGSVEWRTAFGVQCMNKNVCFVYDFLAIQNIKKMILGLVTLDDAIFDRTLDTVASFGVICHELSAKKDDLITMRFDLNRGRVIFSVNGYEVRTCRFDETVYDDNQQFKLAVSLCRQYDAIEMIGCNRI